MIFRRLFLELFFSTPWKNESERFGPKKKNPEILGVPKKKTQNSGFFDLFVKNTGPQRALHFSPFLSISFYFFLFLSIPFYFCPSASISFYILLFPSIPSYFLFSYLFLLPSFLLLASSFFFSFFPFFFPPLRINRNIRVIKKMKSRAATVRPFFWKRFFPSATYARHFRSLTTCTSPPKKKNTATCRTH